MRGVNIKPKNISGRGNSPCKVGAHLELLRSIKEASWVEAERAEESNREASQKGSGRAEGHHESFSGLCRRFHLFINFSA